MKTINVVAGPETPTELEVFHHQNVKPNIKVLSTQEDRIDTERGLLDNNEGLSVSPIKLHKVPKQEGVGSRFKVFLLVVIAVMVLTTALISIIIFQSDRVYKQSLIITHLEQSSTLT